MADLFGIAVSGLSVSQQALDVAGHNIANVNNPNYSRQQVSQGTRIPELTGAGAFGTGAQITDIKRSYDEFAVKELRSAISFEQYQVTSERLTSRLDNLFGDPDTGLTAVMEDFYSSVHQLTQDPTSIPAREVLLQKADVVARQFNGVNEELKTQRNLINTEIEAAVVRINALADNIAELNNKIVSSGARDGAQLPNDLLDRRDAAIAELAEEVDVQTIQISDGSLNVFVGSGQILVLGGRTQSMSTVANDTDPLRTEVALENTNGDRVNINNNVSGGSLGSLMDFRENVLEQSFNSLGRVAIGLAETFNNQHQLGMDLENNLGGLFFTDVNSAAAAGQRVAANVNNNPASPVSLEVQISNVAELTDDEYQLDYDGGTSTWTLRNLNDRSLVTSFPEPAAAPALIPVPGEGFSINFTAIGALGGESYRIQPVRNGADELGVVIQDPQDIAAASPIRTQTALDNIGTGIIGAGEVTDTTNATFTTTAQALTPPLEINFISSTEYEILDSTTGLPVDALNPTYNNYVPGQTNDILALAGLNYGYSFTISGEPVSGDTFTVGYNTDGVGDNRNIVALAALQTTKTLDNGTTNYQESYGRLVSEVGAKTEEAKINAKTAEALREQAQQRRDSVSAVNLDEEAANLIKFQQAYQANARVLSTVQQLIDVLFAAVQ